MKKAYSKPVLAKSAVDLQTVTALTIATGPTPAPDNGGGIIVVPVDPAST